MQLVEGRLCPVLPLSFAWVLVFLLSRAAKPTSSLDMAPSASSNSIFTTTSSLCSYTDCIKSKVHSFEKVTKLGNDIRNRRTLIFLPLLPSPFFRSAFLLASAFMVLVTRGITRRPCGVGIVSCFTFTFLPFPAAFLTGTAAFSFSFASEL